MISRIIFLIIKHRIFVFLSVVRLYHSKLERWTFCSSKYEKVSTFFEFGGKPREIGEASNFKCNFKIYLTPMLTLSQLLFTFQQLSSRFLQNLFLFIFSSQFAGMRARPGGTYGDRGALSPIYLIYNNPILIREGRLSPL